MPRKYHKREGENLENNGLVALWLVTSAITSYFVFVYNVDKAQFWYKITHYILPVIGVLLTFSGAYAFFVFKSRTKDDERKEELFRVVKECGFESAVISFIDRFGKEGKRDSWKYRNYTFDWNRLSDFRDVAIQNNIHVSSEDFKDLTLILKHYIDVKEVSFLNNGILAKAQHNFSELNKEGSDFEHLIVRLYDAMGYTSKRTGGSGDQGADVIASKDGVNVLIQAKCYTVPVSNKAVQEAFSALQYHGCTQAVVITTSSFTPGAVALAKADSVELIDGEHLQKMLLEHLDEVWL